MYFKKFQNANHHSFRVGNMFNYYKSAMMLYHQAVQSRIVTLLNEHKEAVEDAFKKLGMFNSF